jgi:hypothetical protein
MLAYRLTLVLVFLILHEPSLPSFIGRLLEFQGTLSEEPTPLKAPQVAALIGKVNLFKEKGLTDVCVAAHWMAQRVQPLKKQVHLGWEYSGLQDPTRETQKKMALELLVKHLEEIFQDISTWPADEQVRPYHIGIEKDPIIPKSFGLGAHGGPQLGEGSSVPRPEKQPRQYSRVVESLWDNPDFIQAGFHISRYVSASKNAQGEQEQIKALYSSMKTTYELIDVSFYAPSYLCSLRPNSSLI